MVAGVVVVVAADAAAAVPTCPSLHGLPAGRAVAGPATPDTDEVALPLASALALAELLLLSWQRMLLL